MARADLTAQKVTISGLEPALTAATVDGDVFDAGAVILYVLNGDETDVTVTVTTPATVAGLAVADPTVTVTAGEFRLIGPFPRSVFGQAEGEDDAGRVYVDYAGTDVTAVTRGLISL